ncbi:MAG: flavin reductase family protein [Bryobacteraceae bacterium]|nr:flavin reductase family protein [Bryobacteraceae bacterium]
MSSEPLDPRSFRRACARFATGIAVAGVLAPDGSPHGLTVNSFTSVSCDPPIVLICIDHRCSLISFFRQSRYFGVSVLEETQLELSVKFSGRSDNRFEGVDWRAGRSGVPLLEAALSVFECRVEQQVDVGDHTVFFGEVTDVSLGEGKPLLYFDSAYRHLE